jgi:rhodanese-related sulfurtransferase
MSPGEFSARLHGEGRKPIVLDVQRAEDYAEWRIPNSENLDIFDELQTDPEAAKEGLSTIPDDREVVVVCTAGDASVEAAETLDDMGYDVKRLGCSRR